MLAKSKLLLSFLFIILFATNSKLYANEGGKGKEKKSSFAQFPMIIPQNSSSGNHFYIGPALLRFGNSKFHYKAYGFNAGYTHLLSSHFGATVEGGMNWHSAYSISYKVTSIAAGATVVPFGLGDDIDESRFTFSLHALGGIAVYDIKNPKPVSNINQNSLLLNLGMSEDCLISTNFKIRLQADYLPTFFNSEVQYNYRLSLGALLNF